MNQFTLYFVGIGLLILALYLFLFFKICKREIGKKEFTIHIMLIVFIIWFFPNTLVTLAHKLIEIT